ncbi:rRNA maturation RNase YbeY [bacterium]|nr:rRNA maturation RNase YbeY [bacterium]
MRLELVDHRSEPGPLPLDERRLAGLVADLGGPDWHLNLVLVDDGQMTGLREQWYGGQGPTDVLSFSYLEDEGPGEPALRAGEGAAARTFWLPPHAPDEPVTAGEVVLAPRFVAGRCAREGHDPEAEWALLLVHGALHVLGWTHDDDDERDRMRAQEASILARAGMTHPLTGQSGGDA